MGKNTHTHTNISSISLLQSNLKTNQQSKQIRSSTTIMSASTVNVKNISSATSEKEIKDFFSFCGKISSIEVTKSGESQNATVTFEKRLPRRLPSSSTTPNSVPHKFKFPAPLDLTMMMEATSHKTPSETAMRSHKKRNPVPVSLLSTLPTATYSVTRPSRRPSISTPSTEFPTASCPPSPTSIRSTMPPTRPSLLINPMVSPKRPTISSLA